MLRVPIAYAKPGMLLALPIYHPRRQDTALLKPGRALDDWAIGRLRELRVREIWVRYPGMDFVGEYICPAVFESQAALTHRIGMAFDAITEGAHARLDYSEYRTAIYSLLCRLLANPKAAIFIQELAENDEPGLRHSSNVCLISLLMGLKLEDYLVTERARVGTQAARDVSALGVGAMMHDIGMLRLDPAVVERWNATQNEADPEFQRHVWIGYEMVKEAIGPAAAAGVLNHHQKYDGSGFPRRARPDGSQDPVKGSDIHVFARIIAGADLYDRLRHPPGARPDTPPTPIVRVLRQLQHEPYIRWIDGMIFKALLAVVPAYAPGTIVRLNNGAQAVVAEWFPDDPCRPTVHTIPDAKLNFTDPTHRSERLVLRRRSDLSIAEAEGQDVSKDNFYPSTPGQFDLRLAGKALFNGAAKELLRAG